MKMFIDTEFIETDYTQPVHLLSLGIVAEDGREYYAEPLETDRFLAGDWVRHNVLPHLTGPKKPRAQIAQEVIDFCNRPGDPPSFFGYFSAYDWLLFSQLFGRMLDLPTTWPNRCNDLAQMAYHLNIPKHRFPVQQGTKHNALNDARWNRELYEMLRTDVHFAIPTSFRGLDD